MNRIPVWNTVRFAYTFAFGEIGTIIGLIWVPMVAIAVLQFLPFVLGTGNPAGSQDNASAGMAELLNLFLLLSSLLMQAMIYVVVTRQALGLRQGEAIIHFEIGRMEWRMLSAMLLCFVLVGAMIIAFSATLALFEPLLAPGTSAPAAAFVVLYLLAGIGALVYASVRVIFLVFTVVVVEDKVDLRRSWSLTAGNFWRAFAVIAATAAPVTIINTIAFGVIAGPGLYAPLPSGAEFAKAMQARIELLNVHTPMLIGVSLVLAPFVYGLILGAAAGAYRALVPTRTQQA